VGERGNRVKAWASVKPRVIRSGSRSSGALVDNCEGASGLERGARFLRGETSEGEPQERLRHEIRSRNSGLLGSRCGVEKARERNRREHGTARVNGAHQRDVVEEEQDLGSWPS